MKQDVHAGTGKNLAEARAPGYLDTPNGRVALIATATFRQWNQAGEQRPDLRGRSGINPLGFDTTIIDRAAFEQLQRMSRELGFEMSKERARKHFYSDKEIPDDKAAELVLLGNRYVLDKGFSISTKANSRDLEDNLRWIREARRQADWVVVSAHCHEFGGETLLTARTRRGRDGGLFHGFCSSGNRHGGGCFRRPWLALPHGVEIYQGKPIFYSVGTSSSRMRPSAFPTLTSASIWIPRPHPQTF